MNKVLLRLLIGVLISGGVWLSRENNRNSSADISAMATSDSYTDSYNALVGKYNGAINELDHLFERPKWGRDDWIIEVRTQYRAIQSIHSKLVNLKPPQSKKQLHIASAEAMLKCKEWAIQAEMAVRGNKWRKFVEIEDTLLKECNAATDFANLLNGHKDTFKASLNNTASISATATMTITPTDTGQPTK